MEPDLEHAADRLLDNVQEHIRRNLTPLVDRLKAVEARAPEKGEPGEPGTPGEPGVKGDPGDRGDAGQKGDAGEKGEPGIGEKGEPGKDGEPGLKGDQGEKGDPGLDGKSVDLEEVKALVLEALPDLVAKAIGPIVEKAMAQARIEIRETLEKAIKAIPAPERGEKGERGRDGVEGDPGRDALQIDVLSAIDPAEVYRRGTWAAHKGGLWRSFEKTAGMRGWECVVEGFDGAEIDYGEDMRACTVKLLRSSGAMVEKTFQLPTLIHRGVWKQQSYTAGDTVQKDGHLWIAEGNPDAADEPGTSRLWQLAVRRGRDGKSDLRAAALSPVRLS